MAQEVVVTCAVTGAHSNFAKHPNFPITPKQIADACIEARKAGAGLAMEVYQGSELLAAREQLSVTGLVDVSAPGEAWRRILCPAPSPSGPTFQQKCELSRNRHCGWRKADVEARITGSCMQPPVFAASDVPRSPQRRAFRMICISAGLAAP